MNEAIQHLRSLFNEVTLVGVFIKLIVWLKIQYHVQSLPVVWYLFIQPSEIELILNVVFINLK